MRVSLMIEGQEGVTWEDWVAIADACEASGIETLMRSDHYLSVGGHFDRSSLDAWATINALAARTTTLRLGTLVSPASFRHPAVLAKLATTADHVSGGRVELGLGAGWSQPEHEAYGFPFLALGERMEVLEEQLQILHGAWAPGPFDFAGAHYVIDGLDALPKPVQQPHPPVIMGGRAGPRALRLAASYADEYNLLMVTPDEVGETGEKLAAACKRAGRAPIPLSLMAPTVIGADHAEYAQRVAALAAWAGTSTDPAGLDPSWLTGTLADVAARLREYAAVGIQRVYLQDLLHEDIAMIELIGRELVPAVA